MSTVLQYPPVMKFTNPFVGLRAFEESEDYLFFGRGKQIDDLLGKFSESRFLAVIGSSGSGKSSLIKSGLLPAIYSGFMTVSSNWRVAVMRPGENPIGYLAKELTREGTLYDNTEDSDIPFEAIIEASLRRSENGLIQAYKDARLSHNENLLIVIDQFEELFRFSKYERENNFGKSDAIHFIQIILAAARQKDHPIYVLLTMRSDFLGDCAEFRGLPEAINEGQYLVPRMIRDEIREAITGPVTVSNANISQRLVTRLLNNINNDADQLPILQHAMMRTWDAWYKRNQHDTPIDFEDYEVIGTMDSALSLHADEAYSELTTDRERRICELMFKALTDKAADIRGIRRPRSVADLCILTGGTREQVKKIVEIFRQPGRTFLMPPPIVPLTNESIIDISHESLMRIWERLIVWTEEETRSGELYMRLVNSAQLYKLGQRGLLKNPELEIALRWNAQNNPTAKWAEGYKSDFEQTITYLEDSREADVAEKQLAAKKDAARRRLIMGIFALLGVLAISSVIVAIVLEGNLKKVKESQRIADSNRKDAIMQAKAANEAKADAIRKQKDADDAKKVAVIARDSAEIAKAEALKQKEIAVSQKDSAEIARENAQNQKNIAVRQTNISKNQTLKIAVNEYARLIREGPSTVNNNLKEFYGNDYLLAYSYHFDTLANLIAPEDKADYESLRNRLYYNNDLYQRIYEDLAEKKAILNVIKPDNSVPYNPDTEPFGAGGAITRTDNSLQASGGSIGNDRSAQPGKGEQFVAFAVSNKRRLIFCSSTNNFVYVYNDRLDKIDSIAMGAKVTALDFNDENSLIYFGTSIGYIGYIKYSGNRKNQPVFENKLETEVTAIQLFRYEGQPFLLAAGRRSNAKVYKLEGNMVTPDSRLIGNELPYQKNYGDVVGATYLQKQEQVLLLIRYTKPQTRVTTTRTYLWNPFTERVLESLKKVENFSLGTPATKSLIQKTQIYLGK